MIQCFAHECTKTLTKDVKTCSKCNFFLCCSDECLQQHERDDNDDCSDCAKNITHRVVAKLLRATLRYGWPFVVEQTMESKQLDAFSCWSCSFTVTKAVAGFAVVGQLGSDRVKDEVRLSTASWNNAGNYTSRESMREQCMRLASGDENDFLVTIAKLLPGENYFVNSPHVREKRSYDHTFVVVPLDKRESTSLAFVDAAQMQDVRKDTVQMQDVPKDTAQHDDRKEERRREKAKKRRVLVLQTSEETTFTATIRDRKEFWRGVSALVTTSQWSNETTILFSRLFNQNDISYVDRIVFPTIVATPLRVARCSVCAVETEPLHCARCKTEIYCSRRCQQADWTERHSKACRKQVVFLFQ